MASDRANIAPPGIDEPDVDRDQIEAAVADEAARDTVTAEDLIALDRASGEALGEDLEPKLPENRLAMAVAMPVLAAAVMTGGVFIGVGPRIWAGLAGLAGVGVGLRASRVQRAGSLYATIIGGIFAVGLIVVLPTGFGNVLDLGKEIRVAITQGDLLRPPVDFLPGWRAILAWIMSGLGFTAAWIAIELRKPALGLVTTLPVVGIGAISVPESQQLGSGLGALVLFVVGLALLSSAQNATDAEGGTSLAFEARRAMRALPLIAGVTVALYFAAQSNFLFPPPLYDPAQEAKKPKTVPLSEVEDRVLFTVDAKFTGPWKMGSLDVYDGEDWRLPPFSQAELKEVPASGIVDEDLEPGVAATFTVQGLGGAILPVLPNTVGLIAEGPKLSFDARSGNLRLAQGQIEPGLEYIVAAAKIPSIAQLKRTDDRVPKEYDDFLEIPDPPPGVERLLEQAPDSSPWDKVDFLRLRLLDTVVAAGAGSPKSVTPETVEDLLFGSKEGTPFEIVAAQAMLARWAGVPSRIGYGFDGGDQGPSGLLEVRPKHGAVFLEVFFDGYGWLPIIGDPLKAKESFSQNEQQFDPRVSVSNDVAVRLFVPVLVAPESQFFEEARSFVFRLLPIIGGLMAVYYLWPLPYKAFRRARRRSWANEHGPTARIALAYAEWRDTCTDYGYRHYTDTPLMFLDEVVPDEEHGELAWLTTRALWGDLHGEATEEDAIAAEELSRSLRKRLSTAHAATLRIVAVLSRLSVRHPYAPDLDFLARGEEPRVVTEKEEKSLARA